MFSHHRPIPLMPVERTATHCLQSYVLVEYPYTQTESKLRLYREQIATKISKGLFNHGLWITLTSLKSVHTWQRMPYVSHFYTHKPVVQIKFSMWRWSSFQFIPTIQTNYQSWVRIYITRFYTQCPSAQRYRNTDRHATLMQKIEAEPIEWGIGKRVGGRCSGRRGSIESGSTAHSGSTGFVCRNSGIAQMPPHSNT